MHHLRRVAVRGQLPAASSSQRVWGTRQRATPTQIRTLASVTPDPVPPPPKPRVQHKESKDQKASPSPETSSPVYNPPALGMNPAYDEALKYIQEDKICKYKQVEAVNQKIEKLLTAIPKPSPKRDAKLAELRKQKFELQVHAEINDPDVRWRFKNGLIDMSIPVYRHMRDREWRRGPVPKLLERIHQMYVVPDVFPSIEPTIDLEIKFDEVVEPGIYQRPGVTVKEPTLTLTNFHEEERLYTVLMVDPDMPDVANQTYQTEWHWLMINIPLRTTKSDIEGGQTVLPYVPPHPPRGTKYHRYTIAVLEQPGEIVVVDAPQVKDVRKFVAQHSLTLRGASFFREVWDEDVRWIYAKILRKNEPVYGMPPRIDPYVDRTGLRPPKYVNL